MTPDVSIPQRPRPIGNALFGESVRERWSWRSRFPLGVLGAVFAWILVNAAWISDDAYIVFRTVDNAVHGHGLRWNVAERVQSYTGPLWTLLLTAASFVTREYFFTAVALSLACSVAAVILLLRRASPARAAALWLLLALMCSKAFVDFTTSGLENALGYLLVAAFGAVFLGKASGVGCQVSGVEEQGSGFRGQESRRRAGDRLDQSMRRVENRTARQHSTPNVQAEAPAHLGVERLSLPNPDALNPGFSNRGTLKWLFLVALIAALGACNRMDTALIFAPAVAYAFWTAARQPSVGWRRALPAVLLAGAPFIAWEVFSLVYYGFPFPNTAYAKLHTGIPARKLLFRGVLYVMDSLERDPVTLGMTALALLLALASREGRRIALGAGAAAYALYTVKVGGDFMSGRFFALPFWTACVAAAGLPLRRRVAAVLTAGCLLLGLRAERPTFTYNGTFQNTNRPRYIADERGYYYLSSGLLPVIRNGGAPSGKWVEDGKRLREAGAAVAVRDSIGFLGFFAGPAVHIVDRYALCDPLLARMEVPDKDHWRIGHFDRLIPKGYAETLASGENRIANPRLRKLHDVLNVLTREPVWSRHRLREILRINLGAYDDLMHES